MRILSSELYAAQRGSEMNPYIELALSYGGVTEKFYKTRLLSIEHEEQPLSHRATILLDNSDGSLSDKDYKGWDAVLSYGTILPDDSVDDSSTAPLKVIEHYFGSAPSNLTLSLTCVGIPNLLAEDRAKSSYMAEPDDATTLQEYFTAIAGATLAPFTECPAYEVVYDSVDGLIDTYQPKDSFRIYKGQSRLGILRSIIDFTGCVMRVRADGKIHVFVPKVSGEDYDDEFAWRETAVEGEHPFFSKGFSEKVIFPNRIVVESPEDDDPLFSGEYIYHPSYDKIPSSQYEETYLTSTEQAELMAENIAMKYLMAADGGNITLPIMNCGSESFDYVKVTDERQGDSRVGNIGKLIRRWNPNNPPNEAFTLTIWFGGWLSIRQTMNNLENYPSGFGTKGAYFARLTVKDLYAENITADNLDMVWIDPEGNVDLSLIGDTLDGLADGATYARVKSLHLDAGQIVMDEAISYEVGYNPSEKRRTFTAEPTPPYDIGDLWLDDSVLKRCTIAKDEEGAYEVGDWTATTLDAIAEGTTYQRVLSTQISAGKIYLSDQLSYATGYNPSEKRRTFTAEPTTPYDIGDLWLDDTVVKRCTTARADGAYNAADWTATTLDAIANGTTYSRVATASLTAEGLVLLDQVSTGTYGLVLAASLTAGGLVLTSGLSDDLSWGTSISTALANAATAQSTADGKIVTFYQASAPTAEGEGDIWFDTDDGNKCYRWSGSAWVSAIDSDIATAISNASTAQATADGKAVTFYQDASPTAEGESETSG